MAAVSTPHMQDSRVKIQESDEEAYSPNTRDTVTPDYNEEDKEERPVHAFSIHNVLKKERTSPENVFSTEKLLQNTPNYEDNHDNNDSRNSESVSPRIDYDDNQTNESRAEISVDDDNSCCSDDTVLSVGNEAPPNYESNDKDQGLTSFKHIQTHLNAISQLSQNLTMNQPLILRPNPITPNPLMFLNQPLLFQNPIMDIKAPMNINRPAPSNLMNPQVFNLNFGRKTHDLRNARTDENRRLNYMTPKSPDESRDFMSQSLKFSIDNILKADFGRRITDPLNKRKVKRPMEVKEVKESKVEEARVPEVKPGEKGGAIDLSKGDDSASNSGSTTADEHISEEILALLGEAPEVDTLGPDLLSQISSRWALIIKKGLLKEEKDRLMKKYPAPGNCKIVDAPKLNPEAQAAVGEINARKDKAIEAKQRVVSCALSALGLALNKLCRSPENQDIITLLGDSARLLCEYQHCESAVRKRFILTGLDSKKAREAMKDTDADQWLFGEDLSEKLKASKAIERSSRDLKGHTNKSKKSNTTGNLNSKGPTNNTFKPRVQGQKPYQQNRKQGNISAKPYQQKAPASQRYNNRR